MYTVLIVDDEEIIRRGLKVIIDWAGFGVQEILTAPSGEEAVRILAEKKVDFMLTDLCMVNMSGLELIDAVNRMDTDMRIVVLTGYDSFEYARQCCRMEVHDFLLKPIDRESLERTVGTQLAILQKSREEKAAEQIRYRAEGLAEQYRQEKFCRALIDGNVGQEEVDQFCMEYQHDPAEAVQAVVILPVIEHEKSWKEHYEYQYLSAKNICISMYDTTGQGITFEDALGRIVVSMFGGRRFDEVEERVCDLKSILQGETGRTVNILVGCRVEGLRYLGSSYRDAVSMIPQINEKLTGIYNTPKSELRLKMFRETAAELQRLMSENINDLSLMLKVYETYVRCLKSYNLSDSMARRSLYQLIAALYYEFRLECGEKEPDYLNHVFDMLSASDRETMTLTGKDCILHLFSRNQDKTNEIIRAAREYIESHLSDELSLNILAKRAFVSPVYFSRLFKQETGEGFNEYVVKKRMEQAKSLLISTALRSGEVAFRVGYKDVNYFSAAFKKNVGVSPKEYREADRKKGMAG